MFYSTELNLNNINDKYKMLDEILSSGISEAYQIVEFMAVDKSRTSEVKGSDGFVDPDNITELHKIQLTKEGFDFQVDVRFMLEDVEYGRSKKVKVVTIPFGSVVRRKNSKKQLDSIKFEKSDLYENEEFKSLFEDFKLKVFKTKAQNIVKVLTQMRDKNIILEDKKLEYGARIDFESVPKEERLDYLKNEGFQGIENYGIHEERPDGFGYTCGTSYEIDFLKKTIRTISFSSDD